MHTLKDSHHQYAGAPPTEDLYAPFIPTVTAGPNLPVYAGSYSLGLTVIKRNSHGILAPTIQSSDSESKEAVSELLSTLHQLVNHIMPKLLSAWEYQSIQWLGVNQSIFALGSLEPGPTGLQMNVSTTYTGGELTSSISPSGSFYPDPQDCPYTCTLAHELLFPLKGQTLVIFCLFNQVSTSTIRLLQNTGQCSKATVCIMILVSPLRFMMLQLFISDKRLYLKDATKYGYVNRVNYITYYSNIAVARFSSVSISPSTGFGGSPAGSHTLKEDKATRIELDPLAFCAATSCKSTAGGQPSHSSGMLSMPPIFNPLEHQLFVKAMCLTLSWHVALAQQYHITITTSQFCVFRKQLLLYSSSASQGPSPIIDNQLSLLFLILNTSPLGVSRDIFRQGSCVLLKRRWWYWFKISSKAVVLYDKYIYILFPLDGKIVENNIQTNPIQSTATQNLLYHSTHVSSSNSSIIVQLPLSVIILNIPELTIPVASLDQDNSNNEPEPEGEEEEDGDSGLREQLDTAEYPSCLDDD
ncbi:hypothetical protein DAEQUDRAFT_742059 [Daedalea quercina L-15889]|uniref:Uncharacterized protein n=1 Tax=Daedalea quercina L-15889 TaxID=1314783 RepID=A0A165KJ23_9APHY|nr:hypothetical protein DAEQUDRAFT_742059 [Daedalea quercina L-15889]